MTVSIQQNRPLSLSKGLNVGPPKQLRILLLDADRWGR